MRQHLLPLVRSYKMTIKYTVITAPSGNDKIQAELDNDVFMFIPIDESNSDYQQYLNPQVQHLTDIVPTSD